MIPQDKIDFINQKFQWVINSEAFQYSRSQDLLSLQPVYVTHEQLRVQKKLDAEQGYLKRLSVILTQPGKFNKFRFAVNMIYLMRVDLKQADRRVSLTYENKEEYDVLVDSLLEGFFSERISEVYKGVELVMVEYFLFLIEKCYFSSLELLRYQH